MKIIKVLVICIIVLIGGAIFVVGAFAQEEAVADETAQDENVQNVIVPTLYVQEGCGHCKKVEAFIEENELQSKVIVLDTSVDPGASEAYTEFFDERDIPLEERGVPLFVYGDGDNDYLQGDTPIIGYFQEMYDITEEELESNYETGDYVLLGVGAIFVIAIVGYGIVKAIDGSRKK